MHHVFVVIFDNFVANFHGHTGQKPVVNLGSDLPAKLGVQIERNQTDNNVSFTGFSGILFVVFLFLTERIGGQTFQRRNPHQRVDSCSPLIWVVVHRQRQRRFPPSQSVKVHNPTVSSNFPLHSNHNDGTVRQNKIFGGTVCFYGCVVIKGFNGFRHSNHFSGISFGPLGFTLRPPHRPFRHRF